MEVLTVISILAPIFGLVGVVTYIAQSTLNTMLRKYPALLEKVCQDIDAFPHLLERIGEILQEDGMMSLTALTTIRRDAEGVYYRVRRELSHMHRHEQKSVLEYMERLKGYEALQNIATQLQEQRNSLKLILVLIPRPQVAPEGSGGNTEERISSPDMAAFSSEAKRHHLETIISPDGKSVVHTLTNSYPNLTTATAEWEDSRPVGSGANGTLVMLQSGPSRNLRAVKRVFGHAAICAKEINVLSTVSDSQDLFVQFLGWYSNREFTYIVMEFVECGDLSTFIESQGGSPVLEGTSREITRQILNGIKVLHGRQICHRDLKPQNILVVTLDPIHVKITDFGVSKRMVNTQLRTRVGTVGYTAPEVLGILPVSTHDNSYGSSVDLWAMGCIIYELFTLRRPFDTAARNEPRSDMLSGVLAQISTEVDMPSFYSFCLGGDTHILEVLRQSGVSVDAVGVVEALLRRDPSSRLSASKALELPWFANPGQSRE